MMDRNLFTMPGHDTERCYHLQNIFQDHINSGVIKVDVQKHKSDKYIDNTNRALQIYTDLFSPHSTNFISASDPPSDDGPFVNTITVTPICLPPSQKAKVSNISLSFTPLDAPYCGVPTPFYIPTKLKDQTIIGVMVEPFCRVVVII